jgi:hypothetical protein
MVYNNSKQINAPTRNYFEHSDNYAVIRERPKSARKGASAPGARGDDVENPAGSRCEAVAERHGGPASRFLSEK